MIGVAASILLAGFAGSLHCASMCGGLVAFSTGGAAARPAERVGAIAAYNLARGGGYVALGAAAGALGSTLDHVGVRVGLGKVAGAIAGLVMIAWGLARLFDALGISLPSPKARPAWDVPARNLVRRLRDKPPAVRSAIVGGCTAALPCGFLHVFVVAAAGTGGALSGALVLAAFWAGTLPAVVGIGAGVDVLLGPLRRHGALVASFLLVTMGLSTLSGRWSPRALLDLPELVTHEGRGHVR
jgi:sulfite exporter TauE/SafE